MTPRLPTFDPTSSPCSIRNALSGSPPAGVVTEEMLSAHDWYTIFGAASGLDAELAAWHADVEDARAQLRRSP